MRRPLPSVEQFVQGIRSADRVLLGQSITLVESAREDHQALAREIIAQLLSVLVVCAYSASATYILLRLMSAFKHLRVRPEVERSGLDLALHGETIPWSSYGGTGEPLHAASSRIEKI